MQAIPHTPNPLVQTGTAVHLDLVFEPVLLLLLAISIAPLAVGSQSVYGRKLRTMLRCDRALTCLRGAPTMFSHAMRLTALAIKSAWTRIPSTEWNFCFTTGIESCRAASAEGAQMRRQPVRFVVATICFLPMLLIGTGPLSVSAQEMMRERPPQRQHHDGGRGRGFGTGVGIGVGIGIGGAVIDQLQRQQAQDPKDVPAQTQTKKSKKKKDSSTTAASKKKKKDDPGLAKKKDDSKPSGKKKDDPGLAKKKDDPQSSSKKKDEPGLTTTKKDEPGPSGKPPEEPAAPGKPPIVAIPQLPEPPALSKLEDCEDCNELWEIIVRLRAKLTADIKKLADAEKGLEDERRQRDELEGKMKSAKGWIQKAYYEDMVRSADEHIAGLTRQNERLRKLIEEEKQLLARWIESYQRCVDKHCAKQIAETPPPPPPAPPKEASSAPPAKEKKKTSYKDPKTSYKYPYEPGPTFYPPPRIPTPPEPVSTPPKDPNLKICGPDITDLVLDVLSEIRKQFHLNPSLRKEACSKLIDPKTGTGAWDISALSPFTAPIKDSSYDPQSDQFVSPDGTFRIKPWFTSLSDQCAIPRPICGATVEFLGTCQHAQVVNYTQWGMMMALCGGLTEVAGAAMHRAYNIITYGPTAPASAQDNMVAVGKEYNKQLDSTAGTIMISIKHQRDTIKRQLHQQLQGWDKDMNRPEKECELACKLTDAQRKALKNDFNWDFSWSGLTHSTGVSRR